MSLKKETNIVRLGVEKRVSIPNVPDVSVKRFRGEDMVKSGPRRRTFSTSKSEDHLITNINGMNVYTKGRPPWYDNQGNRLSKPYIIGICGGSASGKTSVAKSIIGRLGIEWVTILSMDSFYKELTSQQQELASRNLYNFDTPEAFDFDLMYSCLKRLGEGKSVEVPVYNFTTHSREKNKTVMYGADVLVVEGILTFYDPQILNLMDLKLFVDTDADTRLARRLERDTIERGRHYESVLEQYLRHVKPSYEAFIDPGSKLADVIIPRGGENDVAIDLITRHIQKKLSARGYDSLLSSRQNQSHGEQPIIRPDSLIIIDQTKQVTALHTTIRNLDTSRDEFIFCADRLSRLLIERACNEVQYNPVEVHMPSGEAYSGSHKSKEICSVAIMRAGETLEKPLRMVIKDCKVGKILIQTNVDTRLPELHFLRLPNNISDYHVLLLDATVASGSCAIMAIRVLLDHDVSEENITLCALLMTELGVQRIAYAFPRIKLITTAIDSIVNQYFHIIPGMGNFGDRYFGTDCPSQQVSNSSTSSDKDGLP